MTQPSVLRSDDLDELLRHQAETALSLYMPVQTAGARKRENSIRFQNLLRRVEEMLEQGGWRTPRARRFLRPLEERFPRSFWDAAGLPGFALFVDEPRDVYRYGFVTEPVEEIVTVHSQLHLKPLVDWSTRQAAFHLLELTLDRIALYRGDAFGLSRVEDPGIPETIEDALGAETEMKSLQFHTQARPDAGGDRSALYHGQGDPSDRRDSQVRRFYQRVAGPLASRLRKDRLPLVLCGVPEACAEYRAVNAYEHLAGEEIPLQPDSRDSRELRERAAGLLEREEGDDELSNHVAAIRGAPPELRRLDPVEELLPLAFSGRVECALVARDREVWGRFDSEAFRVELHSEPGLGRADLLDLCARAVLKHGGGMRFVPSETLSETVGAQGVAVKLRAA